MPTTCPFCGASIDPMRNAAGQLVCPACNNTGRAMAPMPAASSLAGGQTYEATYAQQPPWTQPPAWTAPPQQRTNGLAVAALVLGILCFPLYFLAIILAPLAIIFGAKARGQIRRDPGQKGDGLALAGLILGCVGLVFALIIVAAIVFVLVTKLSAAPLATGPSSWTDEAASAAISSPAAQQIYVTLVSSGQHGPYHLSDMTLQVDSRTCHLSARSTGSGLRDSNGDGAWGAGETIILGSDATCARGFTSGSTHLVSVTIGATVIHDNTKVVIS